MQVYIGQVGENRSRKAKTTLLIMYLLTVLWFTVFNRAVQFSTAQIELLWSYKAWFAGDMNLGQEVLANVAMFIPFGFLLSDILPSHLRKKSSAVMLAAILFSLTIETLQLFLMRGLFEWDDVVSNTIGACVGILLFHVITTIPAEKSRRIINTAISLAFILTCLVVIAHGYNGTEEADSTSRAYCFQVDYLSHVDNDLTIEGFCFRYEHPSSDYTLILRAENGTQIDLEKETVTRPDVNEYFACEYDYTASGFRATGLVEEGEYEVLIKWPWSIALPTGVYVGSSIHYVPEREFSSPPIEEDFVKNGVLRIYRPDFHCWVYQYGGSLYWIVDQNFYFEDDGSTYIQYQLYTTQTDKLPQHRLDNNWLWDNIGGDFEKYEIVSNFGDYRVMKRELPTRYSITSIQTGYHKDGKWIWQEFFRPYYEF